MNKMNSVKTDKNNYKISNEFIDEDSDLNENTIDNDGESIWKIISYFGILAIICVLSFLVAKYIVRSAIEGEESPIDTSERL